MPIQVIIINSRPTASYQILKGDKGDKGDQGVQGVSGANGTNGIDGTNGVDGAAGAKGDQGAKGDPGIDATQAVEGHLDDFNHSEIHRHLNKALLDQIDETDLVPSHLESFDHGDIHTHSNSAVLALLGATGGHLTYNEVAIGALPSPVPFKIKTVWYSSLVGAVATQDIDPPIELGTHNSGPFGASFIGVQLLGFGCQSFNLDCYVDDVLEVSWVATLGAITEVNHSFGQNVDRVVKISGANFVYGSMVYVTDFIVGAAEA